MQMRQSEQDGLSSWSRSYLERFLEDPGAVETGDFSINVSRIYAKEELSEAERLEATEILRALIPAVEVTVRQAMVDHLKSCEFLPQDICMTFIEDVETVAIPMLEFTSVLTDADLIDIVRSKGESHQSAVANRSSVSEPVSEAIVDSGNAGPVATLLNNDGARLWEETMENVVRLFPDSVPVQKALAGRPDLPPQIAEKISHLISDGLHFEMMARHGAAADLLEGLMQQGGEGATLELLAGYDRIEDADDFARQLYQSQRLTTTLVLRAIYFGQLDFFEFALARSSQTDVKEVRRVLELGAEPPFKQLYRKSDFPAQFYPAFGAAVVRLGPEIKMLQKEWNGESRRVVNRLAARRDFDRKGFEAALHCHGTR